MLELNSFHTPKRYTCSSYCGYQINFVPHWIILSMFCLKVAKGGEDAFFVSSYNGGVIAVADGVSGY